ncbi:cell division protein FtsW (lipid II flippase) [Paenibacillus mucilaginosus]|uniref:FtsW/RodA/SpoVE family cell cycle protein n=1 Tax=Paenibacillus mucilaginosus TaxID=61624 RepID=UPI003D1A00F7
MIRDQEEVRSYLTQVISKVRAKEIHHEIRQELEGHIEELALEKESEGCTREEAVRWAVGQMGDPFEVGRDLHRIHRPRMNWGLLAGVLLFVLCGAMAMHAVDAGSGTGSTGLLQLKVIGAAIGIGVMLLICRWDYRKLENGSKGLYLLGLLAGAACWNNTVIYHGSSNIVFLGPFLLDGMLVGGLLVCSAAGGLRSWWENKRWFWLKSRTAYVLLPSLLFIKLHWYLGLAVYLTGYTMMLLLITRAPAKSILPTCGPLLGFGIFALTAADQASRYYTRLQAFWSPRSVSQDASYQMMKMEEGIRSAGWWGQGLGPQQHHLPGYMQESVLAYLIYTYGWGFGILVVFLGCLLVIRLWSAALSVHDRFGKLVSSGLAGMLSFQFGYGILMTLGWLPIVSISIPFLSASNDYMIIQCAFIGLILGVYRRKDLVRAPSGPVRR